jgi:transposase-like protein
MDRLSHRRRVLKEQFGRDPAQVIYEQVYRGGKSFAEAAKPFDLDPSTAWRWAQEWRRELESAAEAVAS